MRLMATLRNSAAIAAASLTLFFSPTASAERINEKPSAGAMVADALVARPLYFVLSQVGSAVYGVTLPFTLLGGNATEAAETLVVTPLQAGFIRCLGCSSVESQVSSLSELDGSKRIRHFVTLSAGMTKDRSSEAEDSAISLGVYMGTHFALSDSSRYDVTLGIKRLSLLDVRSGTNKYEDEMMSYQLFSRFGVNIGFADLMFKLGGHYWNSDREVISGASAEKSTDGFGLIYGLGLDFWADESVRIGLEYNAYTVDTKKLGYDSKPYAIDLNFSFLF